MKQSKNLTTGAMGTAVHDHLRTAHNVVAVPRLTADWNLNRYVEDIKVENIYSDELNGFDNETFPIESIIDPMRPGVKGVLKARANQAVVSGKYTTSAEAKFYISSPDDKYKYWTSPTITDGSGDFPLDAGTSTVQPYVRYGPEVNTNKIVIKIENTWASPKNYSVEISTTPYETDPAVWTTVGGSNPTYDLSTGVLVLYFNGTAWVTTKPATLVTTPITGIKFTVGGLQAGIKRDGTTMKYWRPTGLNGKPSLSTANGANSSLNLIAIEAHLEEDFSDRLISVSDEFDFAESSQVYPVGTITSNQASITLDNTDEVFDFENPASPYYHLLEPNVEFNLEYIYTIGGTEYSVQQFKMYSEGPWHISDNATVSVELEDCSKYLKSLKPNPMMYEKKPVTQLVWRVLDSVGFTDYEIDESDLADNHLIPVFWTTGEETIWEILDSLAQASQTAIWIDGNGKLQVRTRDAAFKHSVAPDWNLLGQEDGGTLPDIITLNQNQDYEANTVNVVYKNTEWKTGTDGNPAMSIIWEPEGDLVVRSTPLKGELTVDSEYLYISEAEVAQWPYESVVQIDGELIRYKGKQFVFFTGEDGNSMSSHWVTSHDEYIKLNSTTLPAYRYRNHFTGFFAITERGVWNTEAKAHHNGPMKWRTKMVINDQTAPTTYNNVTNFYHANSTVGIAHHPYMNGPNDLYFANHDTAHNSGYDMHGTRMLFAPGYAHNRAGIGLRQSGNEEDGYFVELRPTSTINNRAVHNEITLFSRVGRQWNVLSAGVPIPIAESIWYDVDVQIDTNGGTDVLKVFVNGLLVAQGSASGVWKQPNSAKMSMYARGKTGVGFEYVYGIKEGAIKPTDDDWSFFDLKYGGTRGNAWQRNQVWQLGFRYRRLWKKKFARLPYKKNIYFFDEFGPYVHEVREFDVKLDPSPAQYTQLYSTNEWFAAPVEFYSNAFEAKFTIANIGRVNAVLHGEDNFTYGGSTAAITQMCVVLGRDLVISDGEKVTVKDEQAIRKRGPVEIDLESDWIQSRSMADGIANWIVQHWSEGVDELEVEIFGNPLIEVGDVVDIDWTERSFDPLTHQYFVAGARSEFSSGISTSLTLRRVR